MEKKGKRPRLLERAADALRLPLWADPGLPHLELNGPRELVLLHHRGIRRYGETCIEVGVAGGALRVTGQGLELGAMNRQELLIHGTIFTLEFIYE